MTANRQPRGPVRTLRTFSGTRLSRPCYDKPHHCPGWAGGGLHFAETTRCEGGRIRVPHREEAEAMLAALDGSLGMHPGEKPFRFGRCTRCNVVTLPWATRHLDPTNWWSTLRWKTRKARWAVFNALSALRTKINRR